MKMKIDLSGGIAALGLTLTRDAEDKIAYEPHDGRRPQPTVITPATASTQDQVGKAPSDAVVLFDGKDLSNFESVKDGGARRRGKWSTA